MTWSESTFTECVKAQCGYCFHPSYHPIEYSKTFDGWIHAHKKYNLHQRCGAKLLWALRKSRKDAVKNA